MLSAIKSLFSRQDPPSQYSGDEFVSAVLDATRTIQARYEAGESFDDLWQFAQYSDADAAVKPDVRKRVSKHAQNEYDNNPLVSRVVDVWVDDVVGEDGPLLQVATGNAEADKVIEDSWHEWWLSCHGSERMRTQVLTETNRGEAVAVKRTRLSLLKHCPVSLDPFLIEPDLLASPHFDQNHRQHYIDGIHLDPQTKEPVAYDILKGHPGNQYTDGQGLQFDADTFDAEDIYHIFEQRRPQQHRGVSRLAPALPTAGDHRKYLTAVRKAAQVAASLAMVAVTNLPPGIDIPTSANTKAWQTLTMPSSGGEMFVLPFGHDVKQMRSEHPNNTLRVFHNTIVAMIAGCFAMPLARALGWHPVTGYAPARGDLLPYTKRIAAYRRRLLEPYWLNRLYQEFLDELLLTSRFDGITLEGTSLLNIRWAWPQGDLIVDPSRDETARAGRLARGLAMRDEELRVRDRQKWDEKAAAGYGMTVEQYHAAIAKSTFSVDTGELPVDGSQEFTAEQTEVMV